MLTESWHISVSRPSAPDIIIIACPEIPINRKYFTVYAAAIKFHFLTQSQVAPVPSFFIALPVTICQSLRNAPLASLAPHPISSDKKFAGQAGLRLIAGIINHSAAANSNLMVSWQN